METPALRIGAVARRTGVAVTTLRAWESRYGVLRPGRTEGGHRLYSEEDVDRVLAVLRLTSQGWSVGAAAASITAERTPSRLRLVGDMGAADLGRGPPTRRRPMRPTRPSPARDASRGPCMPTTRRRRGGRSTTAFARLGVAFALEES
jgi:DNA-binding transcriptional MerR regulator